MSSHYRTVELFGGAIVTDVPANFIDVSDIRQVPDEQEVYLDANGLSSLIFDLRQRVSHLPSERDALLYHLQDVIGEDRSKVHEMEQQAALANMSNIKVSSIGATVTSKESGPDKPLNTYLRFLLIRLEAQQTDFLVMLNIPDAQVLSDVPATPGRQGDIEFEAPHRVAEKGQATIDRILKTLVIKDWSLFGETG